MSVRRFRGSGFRYIWLNRRIFKGLYLVKKKIKILIEIHVKFGIIKLLLLNERAEPQTDCGVQRYRK